VVPTPKSNFEHTNQLFGAVKSESLGRERAQMVDVFRVIKEGKIMPRILFCGFIYTTL